MSLTIITLKKGRLVSTIFDFLGSDELIDSSLSDTETQHTFSHKINHSPEYNEYTWEASWVQWQWDAIYFHFHPFNSFVVLARKIALDRRVRIRNHSHSAKYLFKIINFITFSDEMIRWWGLWDHSNLSEENLDSPRPFGLADLSMSWLWSVVWSGLSFAY